MMKKIINYLLIVVLLITSVGGAFAVPQVAHAACNIGGVVTGNGLTDCANEFVVVVVMPIVAKFLQLSAFLFDKAVTLNMDIAKYVQSTASETSPIEVVWRMIRDISGMFFIFILIWASIKMILGGTNSKTFIVGVVMSGLLVNFSLFATKVVIDASNSLTLTIYSAIAPSGNKNLEGISPRIMEVVDIQSLFASTQGATKGGNWNVGSIVTVVGGVALMLVLGIAFLAAGVMFLWRFVILLALMAASPLPALVYALPQLKTYSNDFLAKLTSQALFAPVFLFFIYIALKVLTNPTFIALSGGKSTTYASLFTGAGAVAPLVQYGLVIFIIFMGLVTASKVGAKGGEFGTEWIKGMGKWGQGAIRGMTLGTASAVGQHTAGRAAKGVLESERFKDFASNNPNLAVLANKSLKPIAKATFGGTKGGYEARVDKFAKDRSEIGKKLGFNDKLLAEFKVNQTKELESLEREIKTNEESLKLRQITIDSDPEGKTQAGRNAKKEAEEIRNKLEINKKEIAQKKATTESKQKEFKNERAKAFSKALKDGWNPITKSARADAVKAIEKSLQEKKGSEKALEDLRKAALAEAKENSEKESGVKETPTKTT